APPPRSQHLWPLDAATAPVRIHDMKSLIRNLPVLLGLVLFAAWFVLLRPSALGGPMTYTMVSGTSMEPRLHGGDLIVMRRDDSYAVGDIVSYHVPKGQPGEGYAIVHRLRAGNGSTGFTTKGDNVRLADPWTPTDDDIIGRLVFRVPKVGLGIMLFHSPLATGTLAGGLTAFAIARRSTDKGKRAFSETQAQPISRVEV
ncbi:MAG: signal peptidase I, partial [Nocardioides sp.]